MTSLLLLSGGLDSALVAATYQPSAAVFINYGQRPAAGERRAAREMSKHLDLSLLELEVNVGDIGAGLLRSGDQQLPMASSPEWYPYRNQLLITIAAAAALHAQHDEVWIGLVQEDESRHADGTPQFVSAIDTVIRQQEGAVGVRAPAHAHSTAELLADAALPRWLLERTISCHVARVACGECPGCRKRLDVLGSYRDDSLRR